MRSMALAATGMHPHSTTLWELEVRAKTGSVINPISLRDSISANLGQGRVVLDVVYDEQTPIGHLYPARIAAVGLLMPVKVQKHEAPAGSKPRAIAIGI